MVHLFRKHGLLSEFTSTRALFKTSIRLDDNKFQMVPFSFVTLISQSGRNSATDIAEVVLALHRSKNELSTQDVARQGAFGGFDGETALGEIVRVRVLLGDLTLRHFERCEHAGVPVLSLELLDGVMDTLLNDM